MEQARSSHLLINAELRDHSSPRTGALVPLYDQVVELVAEGEGLNWSVLCGSRLLGSVVEMASM